jgi:tetratricopeptide (TPR) repeat protein
MPKFLSLILLSQLVVFIFTLQGSASAGDKREESTLAGSYDEMMAHTAKGRALVEQNQWKSALPEWRHVCNAEPNDVLALANFANCLAHNGDFNGVVAVSSRLLELIPNGFILKLRMEAYEHLHEKAKALADRKVLEKNGYTDETLRFLNRSPVKGGSNKIFQFQQEVQKAPRCQELQLCVATYLLQAGRNAEVIAVAENCAKIAPAYSGGWRAAKLTEAGTFFAVGGYGTALHYLDQALSNLEFGKRERPKIAAHLLATAQDLRCRIYERLGDEKQAISAMTLLIDNHAPDPSFYLTRATLYFKSKNYSQMLANYGLAIKVAPKQTVAYQRRSALLTSLKRYKESILDLNKLVEINPNDDTSYFQRATLHKLCGEYQSAVDDYSMAIKLAPQEAVSLQERAALYRKLGKPALAAADVAAAKKLDDSNMYRYGLEH